MGSQGRGGYPGKGENKIGLNFNADRVKSFKQDSCVSSSPGI